MPSIPSAVRFVAIASLAARAARIDDEATSDPGTGLDAADVAGMLQMANQTGNESQDIYVLPNQHNGGKMIRNAGCSKQLRKTIAKVANSSFDVLQCQGLAKWDVDCSKSVYTQGETCICILRGKKCDVINVPGNTMYMPTTTAPPDPLKPPILPTPCPTPALGECPDGQWIPTSSGDLPGNPYALGHTGHLQLCKQKCCEDKICQAIKFEEIEINGTDYKDDCALYLDLTKFDRNLTVNLNLTAEMRSHAAETWQTVLLFERNPLENATAEEEMSLEERHKINKVRAFEARIKADFAQKNMNASKDKFNNLNEFANEAHEKMKKSKDAMDAAGSGSGSR